MKLRQPLDPRIIAHFRLTGPDFRIMGSHAFRTCFAEMTKEAGLPEHHERRNPELPSDTIEESGACLPISCYIRTLNEERKIGDVVRAARLVADEVLVIDSGSTDETISIANAEGARVIRQPWLGWGHQKRIGEDAARHDWLLDIDADEIVSEELAHEIREKFLHGSPDADVFEIPLITVDPSGRCWYNHSTMYRRGLYDRRKIRMPAHGAWDKFQVGPDLEVGRLSGALFHHSFIDIGHSSIKQITAIRLGVEFLKRRNGFSSRMRVYLGLPYYFFRHYVQKGKWKGGAYGFMMSMVGAYNHWLRDAMLYEKGLIENRKRRSSGKEP